MTEFQKFRKKAYEAKELRTQREILTMPTIWLLLSHHVGQGGSVIFSRRNETSRGLNYSYFASKKTMALW